MESKKRNNKKLSFVEVEQRFSSRKDILLCEDGFIGWSKKSKFYDLIEQDYFWAIPRNVLNQNSAHPNRKFKKIKQTLSQKYGVDNVSQIKNVKEKKRQRSIEKFGSSCTLQNPDIQNQVKRTWKEKYGTEHPQQNEKVKEKQRKTTQKRFGVENVFQSKETKQKINQTNLKKYGVKRPSQLEHIKQKAVKTNLKKYGAIHYVKSNDYIKNHSKQTQRFIKETGEHLNIWYRKQPEPKPGLTSLRQFFSNEEISLQELKQYFENYKEHKSSLENIAEQMFDVKHYNVKPSKLDKLYRPDFRLSPKIFLNVDGLYWHSEANQQDRWYHFNLRKEFESNNYRLFQFRENELIEKSMIVKSIVGNTHNKLNNRIYARKCTVSNVDRLAAQLFLLENHLKGFIEANHIGLYYYGTPVAILSYKHQNNIFKIERFCSMTHTSIVGGFSKLLKHAENNCIKQGTTEIHNWTDLRYGTGNHLKNLGFEQEKEVLGWEWTDYKTTFNRLKCRANMDHRKLTQQQHADELKWHKIYDAGQRLWKKIWNKSV